MFFRSIPGRVLLILLTVLIGLLAIGFIEQQSWPGRDWLQLFTFLFVLGGSYAALSWGQPANKKRLYLAGMSIMLITFLLAGTLAELALRARVAFIPRQVMNALPGRGDYLRNDVFLFDEAPITVGRRFIPNQNAPITGQAREILSWNSPSRFHYQPQPEQIRLQFITDENGYRNNPPLANHYPIVVGGDSFTAGMEVETTWTQYLAEEMGQGVLNLGIPGYGPQAEAAAIRLYGLDKEPEVIIVAYFEGNDLRDAQSYDEAKAKNVSLNKGLADEAAWNRRLVTLTAVRVLAMNLARLLGLRVEAGREGGSLMAVYPAGATINGQELSLTFLDGYVSMLTATKEDIEASHNWQVAMAGLLEARQLAQDSGAHFVLVYIPSKPHVYLPLLPAETANAITSTAGRIILQDGLLINDPAGNSLPFNHFLTHINDQATVLANFAQSHNIQFLDLTPTFQAQAAQGQTLYLSLSTHWNPAGHQLAAQTIAALLRLTIGD